MQHMYLPQIYVCIWYIFSCAHVAYSMLLIFSDRCTFSPNTLFGKHLGVLRALRLQSRNCQRLMNYSWEKWARRGGKSTAKNFGIDSDECVSSISASWCVSIGLRVSCGVLVVLALHNPKYHFCTNRYMNEQKCCRPDNSNNRLHKYDIILSVCM